MKSLEEIKQNKTKKGGGEGKIKVNICRNSPLAKWQKKGRGREASRSTRYPSSQIEEPYLKGSKEIISNEEAKALVKRKEGIQQQKKGVKANTGRNSPLAKWQKKGKPPGLQDIHPAEVKIHT